MRRVLFVDDEANVLEGLKRLLRPLRAEWDMVFASGGPEALELMSQRPFDVLISDMRMPGMDGAELLDHVRRRWPSTIRIILTGQADPHASMRAARLAHRQLSKPCDSETLKATVCQVSTLRDYLADDGLLKLVAELDTIPSMPALYHEVVKELEGRDPSIQRVGAVISQDMGMAAKILQLVNSSFFGLPRRIATPAQAVLLLGLETVQTLTTK